ncbi:MAG: YggT family protein [Clostridiales bacterium]|nr:YggT family protein [Clostridiales bacterium]
MDKIIASFLTAVYYVSDIAQTLMLVRAILSWFPNVNGGKFSYFLYEITEPIIAPVRKLLSKTSIGNSMIDISFLITFLGLFLIQDVAFALLSTL